MDTQLQSLSRLNLHLHIKYKLVSHNKQHESFVTRQQQPLHCHESVPETIKHLNTHYQHCALCRTPRVDWNKKWSDTIITVLHNIHDQSSPFIASQSVLQFYLLINHIIQTTDCRVQHQKQKHISIWFVIMWTFSDTTAIIFSFYLKGNVTYKYTIHNKWSHIANKDNSVQRFECAHILSETFFRAQQHLFFCISPTTYMGDSGSFQADNPSL